MLWEVKVNWVSQAQGARVLETAQALGYSGICFNETIYLTQYVPAKKNQNNDANRPPPSLLIADGKDGRPRQFNTRNLQQLKPLVQVVPFLTRVDPPAEMSPDLPVALNARSELAEKLKVWNKFSSPRISDSPIAQLVHSSSLTCDNQWLELPVHCKSTNETESYAPILQSRRLTVIVDSVDACSGLNAALKSPNSELNLGFDIISAQPTNEASWKAVCRSTNCDLICLDLSLSTSSGDYNMPFKMRRADILAAASRGLFFEIDFGPVFRYPESRVAFLKNLTALLKHVPLSKIVITAGAFSALELRPPSDLYFAAWSAGVAKYTTTKQTCYKFAPANAKGCCSDDSQFQSDIDEDFEGRKATDTQKTYHGETLTYLNAPQSQSVYKPSGASLSVAKQRLEITDLLRKAAARKTGVSGCFLSPLSCIEV